MRRILSMAQLSCQRIAPSVGINILNGGIFLLRRKASTSPGHAQIHITGDQSGLRAVAVEDLDVRDQLGKFGFGFFQLGRIGGVDIIPECQQGQTDDRAESSRKIILPAYSGFHRSAHDCGTFSTVSVLTTIASVPARYGIVYLLPGSKADNPGIRIEVLHVWQFGMIQFLQQVPGGSSTATM